MELLWYGVVLACILGSARYVGLGKHTPRCRDCRTSTLMLSRQVAGTSPPVFEVVYRCPICHEILWRRFVSMMSD